MAEKKTVIIDLKIDTGAYIKNVVDAKSKVADLKAANVELKKSIAEAAASGGELGALNVQLAENEAALRDANTVLKQYEKQVDNAVKANKALDGSYEQLYRQWVDADIALKNLSGTLKQNEDGTFELTEEYTAAQERVLKLKEGLLAFNAGIKDGRLNVGNYAQAMEAVVAKLDAVGAAVEKTADKVGELGDKFGVNIGPIKTAVSGLKQGFDIASQGVTKFAGTGSGAAKILRVAFLSTGIGALVVAVGSLVAYFTQTAEGSKKLKVVLAAIGGVVTSLVKSFAEMGKGLFTIIQGIATFDLSKIKEGAGAVGDAFSGAADKARDAANASMEIVKRQGELEKLKRQAAVLDVQEKNRAENLMKLAEDKSKTESERLQALRDAAELEQKVEARRLQIAQETLDLKRKELAINGESKDLLDEIAASEAEIATIKAEANSKVTDAQIKERNLERDFANQRAARAVAESQAELALLQAQGRDTIAIRKKIAEQEKQVALLSAAESGEARSTIEKQYQAKIAAINQEVTNQAEAVRRAAFDKELAAFGNTKEKEVLIAAEALRRELADFDRRAIVTEEDAKQRAAIVAEGANRLLQIEQKYAAESAAINAARAKRGVDETIRGIDEQAAAEQRAQALRLAQINATPPEERTQEELAFQRAAAEQSVNIEQERLQRILAAQVAASEARKANEEAYYDEQERITRERLTGAGATEQVIQSQLEEIRKQRNLTRVTTEQETADQIRTTQEALNAALIEGEIARTEATGNLLALQRQGMNDNLEALRSTLGEVAALLSQDENSRKKYASAIKALGIAEIYINLYKEIAGYWAGAGADSSKSVLGGIPATVLAGVRTAIAVVRAATGAAAISAQKFAEGGLTNAEDVVERYNPEFKERFTGGYVNRPVLWPGAGRLNLAGEAGSEYVAPAWQLRQAPGLFSKLEQWRRTGVRAFAEGGLTTSAIIQPVLNTVVAMEDAVARGFAKAPAPVVAVTEINEVSSRVSVIESRANL